MSAPAAETHLQVSANARASLYASWGVAAALVVQGTFGGITSLTRANVVGSVLGWVLSIVTLVVFLRWQWRIVLGVEPLAFRTPVALVVVGAWLSMIVGNEWAALPAAMAMLLLVLRPWRGVLAELGMMLALGAFVGLSYGVRYSVVVPLAIAAVGAVMYALTRLAMVIRELQIAREELARTKVDQERVRMQRDLHDMLGRTLVAASLRNQVALRTLDRDVEATRRHLEQLHAIVKEGQANLRIVTSGPVIVSLDAELDAARSLCQRLGITFDVAREPLPGPAVERFVATILRESVTNMLKHSRPSTCSFTIRNERLSVVVTVVNDGCIEPTGRGEGTGLAHLRQTAATLGGQLTAEPLSGGRFPACPIPPWPSFAM